MKEDKQTEEAEKATEVAGLNERLVVCEWKKITEEMPKKRDEWYLFGDYTDDGEFMFDKYHYSLDGRINGWNIERAIFCGCLWWCKPNEPQST